MAFAQEEPATLRPVTSSYTYEIGGATLANTYLTPLKYKGWDMALNYERMQAMKFNPEKWVMRLTAGIDLNRKVLSEIAISDPQAFAALCEQAKAKLA